jgi:para-aminobenzoate synthetase component 1
MFQFPVAYLITNDQKAMLAFGAGNQLRCNVGNALHQLESFLDQNKNAYRFGCLGYDLKNELEKLESKNVDFSEFPDLFFWNPTWVVAFSGNSIDYLQGQESAESEAFIQFFTGQLGQDGDLPIIAFSPRISKDEYVNKVEALQREIQLGNTYEVNFCQEFSAENIPEFDSFQLIKRQFEVTKAPFSAYFSFDEFELFCGSPERYIQREGNRISSQPIKGTIRRGKTMEEDHQLKLQLKNDPKEQSENVMITDLVRNDLSRIALKNSVQVDELFGVYSFETVHHLISTISCEVKDETSFRSIIEATFPMGSMTGAPKISSMELIEKHESFKRGIYSGSIGYIAPNGDFDFNVVIRSFVHNRLKKSLSCAVGGAITSLADAEKEYEECLVKVKRLIQLFGDDQSF